MVREELDSLIKDLALFLERPKPPAEPTILSWLNELAFIPFESLPFIKQGMRTLEAWPRNFPNFIKAKYMEWREKNPHQTRECSGDCHQGFWEVARYLIELKEWAIFRFPCICVKVGGFYERSQLLKKELYEKEPNRYQREPPPWALIFPDADSLAIMKERIVAHLKELKKEKGGPAGPLDGILLDDIPF